MTLYRYLLFLLLVVGLSGKVSLAQVDCRDFQETLDLSKGQSSVKLEYVVNLLDPNDTSELPQGTLTARLTYQGQAWLGFGISPTSNGRMIGSHAIIGLPGSDATPKKYLLAGQTPNQVLPFAEDLSATLMNATIVQTTDETILTFTKLLVEPEEHPINAWGVNTFLWAHGFTNTLNIHEQKGAFALTLRPCNAVSDDGPPIDSGDTFQEIDLPDTYQSLWSAHGVLAGIAWGVFVPLAIASSLLRDLISIEWLWVHMGLNIFACIMTLTAFALAVTATEKGTLEGESANHFSKVAHRTVGLVIVIVMMIQVGGGLLRPHPPTSSSSSNPPSQTLNDDEEEATQEATSRKPLTKKLTLRMVWELVHRFSGFALLGCAAWQVQDGIKLYSDRFGTNDLTAVFWGVFGGILGLSAALYVYTRFFRKSEKN